MLSIFLKRLKVIPLTLFFALILNFTLIHMGSHANAPYPKDWNENFLLYTQKGSLEDDFSSIYGLDLPLFLNLWPFISLSSLKEKMDHRDPKLIRYAPYILPSLIQLYKDADKAHKGEIIKLVALGTLKNESKDHFFSQSVLSRDSKEKILCAEAFLSSELDEEKANFFIEKVSSQSQLFTLFCETQFYRYFKRVFLLDFGSLKGDLNQKVAPYVLQKLKVSLSFLIWPFIVTFLCSQLIGLWMAYRENTVEDRLLTLLFVLLYGAPIYLMGPFLIEKIAIPLQIPIHGPHFTKISHLILPFTMVAYGAFALYSRVYKSLFNQLLAKEYLLSLKGKGLGKIRLLFVHTLRQALVTTIPLSLGSFGYFMGALIIVENIFEMDGIGKLYYSAITQNDYHVILFTTLLISVLTITFYLLADILLYLLDPRISKSHDQRVFERT